MPDYLNRKAMRLKGYDYSQAGYYFVTLCTQKKSCILGNVVGDAVLGVPHTELSHFGNLVHTVISQMPAVDKFVIMPNHIHIILHIPQGGTPGTASPTTVSKMIGYLKRITNQRAGCNLWQRSFYDYIIRSSEDYQRIWRYIDENPLKWVEDEYYK